MNDIIIQRYSACRGFYDSAYWKGVKVLGMVVRRDPVKDSEAYIHQELEVEVMVLMSSSKIVGVTDLFDLSVSTQIDIHLSFVGTHLQYPPRVVSIICNTTSTIPPCSKNVWVKSRVVGRSTVG